MPAALTYFRQNLRMKIRESMRRGGKETGKKRTGFVNILIYPDK